MADKETTPVPEPKYQRVFLQHNSTTLYRCLSCGAVVAGDDTLHTEWHKKLGQ